MSDMVRCPNCFREISGENRFCIFCGCPLSDIAGGAGPAEAVPDTVPFSAPRFCPKGHDVPDPSLGFCPICGSLLTSTPSSPDAPVAPDESPVPEESPVDPSASVEPPVPETPAVHQPRVPVAPAMPLIRRCRCGYECDDPELNFCPACGLPLEQTEPAPVAVEGEWLCAECGAQNMLDMNFCTTCGHPKVKRAVTPEPVSDTFRSPVPDPVPARSGTAPRRGDRTVIPEGMYMPTDDDLVVKAQYGNGPSR